MLPDTIAGAAAEPPSLEGLAPPVRLYTDRAHYDPRQHHLLLHVLRPIWDGGDAAAAAASPVRLVPRIAEAEAVILPMTWHYYVRFGRLAEAHALAAAAKAHNKLVIVLAAGDQEPIVPIENAMVFHPGPTRSVRRTSWHAFASPSFVPDVRAVYFGGRAQHRRKGDRPVVGFCGHGASPWHRLAVQTARNLTNQIRYRFGRLPVVPEPVLPAVVLRSRVLKLLARSPLIADRFIVREDYRAGLRRQEDRQDPFHPTRLEFVNAIHDSDYTVCVRGGGNFSLRLYEALCLGRIPIFVDTDCVLPYDFLLNWRALCCWVDQRDVPHIAERVADFHAAMTPDDFIGRQEACRATWERWCTHEGFYREFRHHFAPAATRSRTALGAPSRRSTWDADAGDAHKAAVAQ